ncbi:hydantoinase B/oxoprolinase family protein [Ruegeria marina]|uniref:Hydantoinase B/oxoprolinase n=1 Tax=Ruegeria marina TaxID=639004 RepID=A0A1G7C2X4_9RHOB|nr:hydantoinase B/oxoprolinase family protein [Ruegeria marina]SDE33734.1 Hydantoinase B/oxoprolinase [Ruegeria marina]
MDIIRANSREPVANEGDIYALIACCEAGVRRLTGMMDEYGLDDLVELGNYIIDTSYRGTLAAIAEIPEGSYHNMMRVDGYEAELELHATLTVSGTGMHVDFTGTSGFSRKGINVPLNYTTAYTVFALRCIVGPDIPNNAGSLAPFTVGGPSGCILNAQRPAPVAMRHTLGQVTPDLVLGCLHQALPGRVPAEGASCLFDLPMRHAPEVARDGGRQFAVEPVDNGGTGARPHSDGLSTTAFPSGVLGSQVEITESVAPVIIWRRELRPTSGGPGQFRGGLARRIKSGSSALSLTAAESLVAAIQALGVSRVGFSSPYLGEINDQAVAFLASIGIETVCRADIGRELGNYGQGELSPNEVFDLAIRADTPRVQAIVLSCTDMRAVEAVDRIEAHLDKPAVTLNQALMFCLKRALGLARHDRLPGRLFDRL